MTKKSKSKRKRKCKKTEWEKQFIEDHGIEIYERLLNDLPELRRSPKWFESLVKLAPYFEVPDMALPKLRHLYDRFLDMPSTIDSSYTDGRDSDEEK